MSTTKNKRAVVVGIFVLVGVGLLLAIIVTLGNQRKSFAKTITIKAVFDDVSGLQEGNNIWLAGVKVGTVKRISFDSSAKVLVSMSILSSMQSYIHKDAKAKIGSESLIGNKIVVLTEGSLQMPLVKSGDVLDIQASLNTDAMMATLQQNNKNLLDITTNFKELSQQLKDGKGSLGKLLHDETLVNTMQQALNSFKAATANAQKFSHDLSSYTAMLQSKGSLANDLVTDTVIFHRLRNTVIQFQKAAGSAQETADRLNKAASGLNTTSSPVGVLLNDSKAASDLKLTFNNLNSSSQKLNEDLEALQHNFLFRGFFKRKAKAKTDSTRQ